MGCCFGPPGRPCCVCFGPGPCCGPPPPPPGYGPPPMGYGPPGPYRGYGRY